MTTLGHLCAIILRFKSQLPVHLHELFAVSAREMGRPCEPIVGGEGGDFGNGIPFIIVFPLEHGRHHHRHHLLDKRHVAGRSFLRAEFTANGYFSSVQRRHRLWLMVPLHMTGKVCVVRMAVNMV